MEFNGRLLIALGLSALAGLSTTIGSLISLYFREPGPKFMAFSLGFSAGVMVYISFAELLRAGIEALGFAQANAAFFGGLFLMFAIDLLLPHVYILESPGSGDTDGGKRLKKASVLMALGIGIHNFPEGMATLTATLQEIEIGAALAFVIAIHNIPEGIAVAVPVYAATKSRSKAFFWSFLSGISEPVGALVAAIILVPLVQGQALAWMLSIVAGFMVFISFDELLPIAHSYKAEHTAILGVTAGMAIMALSLALLI